MIDYDNSSGAYRHIADVYSAFVSKDGRTIELPVPIDSYLYEVKMDCDKLCEKCPEKFKQVYGRAPYKCNRTTDMTCGCIFSYFQRIKLDIDNIAKILRRYEITIFDSKEKAQAAGDMMMRQRIGELRSNGFDILDNGSVGKQS